MEGDMQAQEIFAILHKWGIHTLGQLAALDKQQLGARLGPEAVRMWERANGQSNRLLKLVRPPESFEERFEFENEIETTLRNPHQLSETLARLSALLGADRVGTPVLEETHRPDAFRIEPFAWEVGAIDLNRPQRTAFLKLALRRFRPAVSASVLVDGDTPAHLRSAEICGKVIEQQGPYLISENCWVEKSWARAEWDVQLESGDLVRVHKAERTWKVDGIYD